MGRAKRERLARILAGEETPISMKYRGAAVSAGVTAVKAYSTNKQVQFLADSLHEGKLSASKLKGALVDNARKEMDKGIRKLLKKNKTPTVDLLLEEYNKDAGFQALASEVGLDKQWFIDLAEKSIREAG